VSANLRGFPPDGAAQCRINSDSERADFIARPISAVLARNRCVTKSARFPAAQLVSTAKKNPDGDRGCALPAVSRLVSQSKLGFHCSVNSGFRFYALLWRDQSKQSGVVFFAGNQSLAELVFQPF